MSKHNIDTTIILLGIDVPVEVEIDLTSHGSDASWDDPGDPPEFEIISITRQSNGEDITEFCSKSFDYYRQRGVSFYTIFGYDTGWQDPIRTVMFGNGSYLKKWNSTKTVFYNAITTIEEGLHDLIMEKHINGILDDLAYGPDDY